MSIVHLWKTARKKGSFMNRIVLKNKQVTLSVTPEGDTELNFILTVEIPIFILVGSTGITGDNSSPET